MINFFKKIVCYIYFQQMGKLKDPNLYTKFCHGFLLSKCGNIILTFSFFFYRIGVVIWIWIDNSSSIFLSNHELKGDRWTEQLCPPGHAFLTHVVPAQQPGPHHEWQDCRGKKAGDWTDPPLSCALGPEWTRRVGVSLMLERIWWSKEVVRDRCLKWYCSRYLRSWVQNCEHSQPDTEKHPQ